MIKPGYTCPIYLYMLRCNDDTIYVGITNDVDQRLKEHQGGTNPTAYTYTRRPVELIYVEGYTSEWTAIAAEKRIKRWSKKKKLAFVDGKWNQLKLLAKKKFK